MKVHHSVTDGVGGMALLTHLVDLERDAAPSSTTRPARRARARARSARSTLVRDSLAHTRRRVLGIAQRVPGTRRARPRSPRCAIPIGAATTSRAPRARSAARSRRRRHRCRRSCSTAASGRRLDVFDVVARRPEARRQGDRGQRQRRVRRRGRRRPPPLPRAARRRARRVAHDAADQPAQRATTRAATASRPRASRCPPTIDDPRERIARDRRARARLARRARAADDEHARRAS